MIVSQTASHRRCRPFGCRSVLVGALLLSPLGLVGQASSPQQALAAQRASSAQRAAMGPQPPTAQVEGGALEGMMIDGLKVFRGIPYAAPPVGNLRWKPPQPGPAWDGVLSATSFSPQCMQRPFAPGSPYSRPPRPSAEDCLYLNVVSGADEGELLPVMVWIHGGSWTRGTGADTWYQGTALAERGVVVVTINYRLGPLGFFAHPELSAESERGVSGNQGLLDQIAALEWVRENIRAFGGDPDRVTIFGESAGAWAVHTLVASPLAKGLFRAAIGESGGQFGSQIPLRDEEGPSAEGAGETFMEAAGVGSMAELRSLSAERLMEVWETRAGRDLPISANVDGHVLHHDLLETYKRGMQSDVPVLIGSNADEGSAFLPSAFLPKTVDMLRQRLSPFAGDRTDELIEVYGVSDDADAANAMRAAWRDQVFSLQMRTWARMTEAAGQNAYLYFFTRTPPGAGELGAFHGAEIPYVFGATDPQAAPQDEELSATMADYWTNFAKTGDPNGGGRPLWQPWNDVDRPYMELGDEVRLGNRLLDHELDFLERGIAPESSGG
jgi:para-nitrobenzyl esterase